MYRLIKLSLSGTVSVAVIIAVVLQQNQIGALKAEREQILTRLTSPAAATLMVAVPVASLDFKQNSHSPSIELLQLRAEVTRLGNRKRQLAGTRAESERLYGQLAIEGTNPPGVLVLPAGYMKKSMAKFVGYNTPEDTIQSFLWAIQNHDAKGFLQALGPDEAKQTEARMQSPSSTEEFFKEADSLPGMHIVGKEAVTDGEVELKIEIMPGVELPARLRFKQFEGQWKLVGGL